MVPPPVPPCAGKESLMACHSSGRIVTVPVYVSWDAEMLPPLRVSVLSHLSSAYRVNDIVALRRRRV